MGGARFMTALAVFFLAIAVVVTSARADGVGFHDISIEVDGERLITALWYPTDAPPEETTVGPFTMAASREAPIGAGRYGLIVISHGTGGGRLNHRDTAIRLAESGYVAVAPEHAGDNFRDKRYSGTSENWRRRPRQLSAVLDRLLGDSDFGPHIDIRRIGAIGHSAGGYSVLALIGGRADMAVLVRHCTRHREDDAGFCGYGRPDGEIDGTMPDLSDPRVVAVVAVAPVGALFGEGAFAGVEAPTQIHRLGACAVEKSARRSWYWMGCGWIGVRGQYDATRQLRLGTARCRPRIVPTSRSSPCFCRRTCRSGFPQGTWLITSAMWSMHWT